MIGVPNISSSLGSGSTRMMSTPGYFSVPVIDRLVEASVGDQPEGLAGDRRQAHVGDAPHAGAEDRVGMRLSKSLT